MRSFPSRPRAETTIVDVAEQAGVSIRTVSRVLNNASNVKLRTREHVQRAMDDLGFQPSARARGLATGRSYLLGLVHNDRNALVLDLVQRGLVEATSRRGYELVVHPTPLDSIDPVGDVVNFAQRSRVDGLVILAPVSGVPGLADALQTLRIPIAALSSIPLDGFTFTAVTDERGAAARAARFLMELGHRRIAIINGPIDVHSARERRAGFLQALTDGNIDVIAEDHGDYGFASGIRAAERLLSAPVMPTAIFAANDIMAAAVLKVARSMGIDVPRDLSLIGFDGSILADMTTPALTTVERPMADIAHAAAQRLLDMIDGVDVAALEPLELRLVEGESTAPAAS